MNFTVNSHMAKDYNGTGYIGYRPNRGTRVTGSAEILSYRNGQCHLRYIICRINKIKWRWVASRTDEKITTVNTSQGHCDTVNWGEEALKRQSISAIQSSSELSRPGDA